MTGQKRRGKDKMSDRAKSALSGTSPCSGSVPRPSSDTLVEMYLELKDPPKWAAHQIATKSYGLKTVGEAMDMIEAIVRAAIEMAHNASGEPEGATK